VSVLAVAEWGSALEWNIPPQADKMGYSGSAHEEAALNMQGLTQPSGLFFSQALPFMDRHSRLRAGADFFVCMMLRSESFIAQTFISTDSLLASTLICGKA
jgi:hypothetical protein